MNKLSLKYCDFQVHSPRDPMYKGWPSELMTLDGLKTWARELLQRCEALSIHCVAITDHHDLVPGILALSVAYETGSNVWVFPGMEITSRSGMQGVLLLDPQVFGDPGKFDLNATEAVANRVLVALGQDIGAHASSSKDLKVTSYKELAELKNVAKEDRHKVFVSPKSDRVDRDFDGKDGIAHNLERIYKDRYLLLPNLEKNKHGVFGNENGRAFYLKSENWFVGGIVGGGNPTDEDAIAGKKGKDFGPKVVACLRTSDQRGQDATVWFGDRLGQPEYGSWLKLSDFTTTSISQALISGSHRRVFQVKPNEPGDRIDKIEITGTDVFGSTPINIAFTPNLNTLVGGRGTGKSLINSALVRLFNCDADWLEKERDDLTPWEARHLTLFSENGPFSGPDVSLAVEYTKDSGVRYRLSLDTPGEPLVTHARLEMWSGSDWTTVAEGDAVKAAADFRPLFFLQGQMSAMTGSRLDQFDLIRLIEGPIRDSRRTLRESLNSLAAIVRDGFQQKRKKLQHEARLVQLQAQAKQKEGERNGFLDAAKKGLTEEQQKLFSEAEVLRQGKSGAQRLEDGISETVASLRNADTDLEHAAQSSAESIKKLQAYSSGEFSKDPYLLLLQEALKRLSKALSDARKQAEKDLKELGDKKAAFLAALNALVGKANEISEKEKNRREALRKAGVLEQEIGELVKQAKVCEQEIQNIVRSAKIEAAEQALAQYKEVVKAYSKQFIKRAEQISGNNEFRLIVRVIPGGLFQPFLEAMKKTCQGCGVREKTWTEFEEKLGTSDDSASIITDLLSEIIASFSDQEKATLPLVWAECSFSEPIFKNILARTKMEDWIQLSVVLAEDKVDVRYKKGSKKPPIPILSASPGERAVELLRLALFSTRGPLIIDQPEDDLDNHFLAEQLVSLVHQSKHTNQLIFSSHNANLVVHGDAEVIHLMEVKEVSEGKIGCSCSESGTIDQEKVCLAVEKVMEGGRAAFEQRRRKYHETIDPDRVLKV